MPKNNTFKENDMLLPHLLTNYDFLALATEDVTVSSEESGLERITRCDTKVVTSPHYNI